MFIDIYFSIKKVEALQMERKRVYGSIRNTVLKIQN